MVKRIYAITLKGGQDMLRNAVTDENCKAVVFNPENMDYLLKVSTLYYKGSVLSEEEVLELVANPDVNKPIKEAMLIYGLFSYLYAEQDIRNKHVFETTVIELSNYLGISTGSKGFKIVEKLIEISKVYGIIPGVGVFPLIEIEEQQDKLIIKSQYLHMAFNAVINECFNNYGERGKYYTDKVYANILTEKNKAAALVAIEIANLIARARGNKAHISVRNIIIKIPQLTAICLSNNTSTSNKNKQLKRVFSKVYDILEDKTSLFNDLKYLKICIPSVNISNLDAVIDISYKGFKRNTNEGE